MTNDMSTFRLERLGAHSEGAPAIILKQGPNTVGRTPANNIVCSSKYVSRKHCEIFVAETGRVAVKNDITVNGVYINGIQQIDRSIEIWLNVNDILGIGCDTSIEEIQDEECFIYQLKRKECEIILLDSDEEEDKIQEEYSQMNLSEMKQEMIELDDFVEEYSRTKNDPDDDFEVASPMIKHPHIEQENDEKDDVGDVFEEMINDKKIVVVDLLGQVNVERLASEINDGNIRSVETKDILEEIISNSQKSYAEKNDLIKKMVPDVASLLAKDCSLIKNCDMPSNEEVSNEPRNDRVTKETTLHRNSTNVINPPPIRKLSFSIPLTRVNASPQQQQRHHQHHHHQQQQQQQQQQHHHHQQQQQQQQQQQHQHHHQQQQQQQQNNKKLEQKPTPNIKQRRSTCYVPSPVGTTGKRQVSIIDAPHMPKRRKSISVMPESLKCPPKIQDSGNKWLSKTVKHQQKKRTKEEKDEIKSKLAALVPDPKCKIVEAKVNRPNLKIPIKNTARTRNDFLTDTIVKTISSSATKTKITEAEALKISRAVRNESKGALNANQIKNSFQSSAYRIVKRDERRYTEVSNKPFNNSTTTYRNVKKNENAVAVENVEKALEYIHCGNGRFSDIASPTFNDNNETTTLPSTSPVVKSILKKTNTNTILKRRATVTFVDDCRPKIAKISTTPAIKCDEESCDEVIHNIMSLGMAALKESSNALHINGKNFAYKTVCNQYETLKNLQSVFVPLMKAELWKEIEDGYLRSKNIPATDAQMNYCVRDENHQERYKYHCETKSSAAVQNGALIIVSNSGKEYLGYIINKQMTNKVCYFQFVTPASNQDSNAYTCTPLKIKQIMYIRPNLKVFEALFKLKTSPLLNHILNPKNNCFQSNNQPIEYNGFNTLNQDQMTTLTTIYQRLISNQPCISLVEGPPGTGKSRLITNLVVQLLYGTEMTQPVKILVCAPSNAAIDILTRNLLEARKKLNKDRLRKMKLVRFGVLEKMDRSVRGVSLQELTKDNNEKNALKEQQRLMEYKTKKELDLAHYTSKNMKDKIAAVRKDIEIIDTKMKNVIYDEKCLLEGANVICTTLNSCCALSNKISSMDICIIDEATQCNEPTCLIPLQFGIKALILVGDTKQLPSTVLSEIAKQYNYDQSLFQRLQKSFESENDNPILQLTKQYRMHPDILHWPNEYFYKNRLVSAELTKNFKLQLKPYTVFNLNFEQSSYSGHKHIANVDEANFVRNLLNFLITKADPKLYSYGIISAYSQQKDDLAKDLSLTHPYVSVNTIDSCQGQERDIVIISIARTRGIGFLAIRQRLNVALTRARKMLILCGNFNSLQSHVMWTNLLDDAKKRKLYIHLPNIDDNLLPSYFETCLSIR